MQPNDEAFGFHVNRVAAVLNGVNPIPLTIGGLTIQNNLSVGGTLGVTGLTTLSGGLAVTNITGPITINPGGLTVTTGDVNVIAGRLVLGAAISKIVPGITQISFRNSADTADNLRVTDAGIMVTRNYISSLFIDLNPGVLDATHYTMMQAAIGQAIYATQLSGRTTAAVAQVATIIWDLPTSRARLFLVEGTDGTNYFSDLVFTSSSAISVLASLNDQGASSARTYTSNGATGLNLTMTAGTYKINVAVLSIASRI